MKKPWKNLRLAECCANCRHAKPEWPPDLECQKNPTMWATYTTVCDDYEEIPCEGIKQDRADKASSVQPAPEVSDA